MTSADSTLDNPGRSGAGRARRLASWLDSIVQDLRYTLRQWQSNRPAAAAAIVTLALGIGASAAIFQLLDVIVLRPLPVRAPDQLVHVQAFVDGETDGFSYPQVIEMSARQNVVEGIFASVRTQVRDIHGAGTIFTQPPAVWMATGNYFRLIGTFPQAGRFFTEADDDAGAAAVAVISDTFWKGPLEARPKAIGSTFVLNGLVFTVVGIAQPDFSGERVGTPADIWIPMGKITQVSPGSVTRSSNVFQPMARLRPGVSREQAQQALSALYGRLRDYGLVRNRPMDYRVELLPGSHGIDVLRNQYERPLWLLMGLVALVVLIACSNLANLLLARAAARTHEIGVRLAIGAPQRRLVRQLFTESLALSAAGGAIGLLLASTAARTLVMLAAAGERWQLATGAHWRVTVFTALLSLAATLVFGLAPALAATRVGLNTALKTIRRTYSSGHTWHTARRTFVVAQIVLSLVVVTGAGLLVRSFRNLAYQNFGYRVEGVLAAVMSGEDRQSFATLFSPETHLAIASQAHQIPGVEFAGVASGGLLAQGLGIGGSAVATQDRSIPDGSGPRIVAVTPGYIEAMGIPILRGRPITGEDRREAPRVAVISESAARLIFGSAADPIGRTFSEGESYQTGAAMRVVGLMPDVRFASPREAFGPLVYAPMTQYPIAASPDVVVRTQGDPGRLRLQLEQAVRDAAPGLKILRMSTLRDTVQVFARRERLLAWLSGGFGALALALAAVGLYGLVAYGAQERTPEVGIRLALGATRRDVEGLLLRELTVLVAAGIAIGVAATVFLVKPLESLLFGIEPHDPATLALAAGLLSAVAILAGFLPAWRAARLDPMAALRQE